MPTSNSLPDDQPISWGEFRTVIKALSQYHGYLTLYSALSMTAAMGSQAGEERLAKVEQGLKEAAKRVQDLAGFDPNEGPDG